MAYVPAADAPACLPLVPIFLTFRLDSKQGRYQLVAYAFSRAYPHLGEVDDLGAAHRGHGLAVSNVRQASGNAKEPGRVLVHIVESHAGIARNSAQTPRHLRIVIGEAYDYLPRKTPKLLCKAFEIADNPVIRRNIRHHNRVEPPDDPFRSYGLTQVFECRDRRGCRWDPGLQERRIGIQGVLEIVSISPFVQLIEMPEHGPCVSRPEDDGVHVFAREVDARGHGVIERILDDCIAFPDPVNEPV